MAVDQGCGQRVLHAELAFHAGLRVLPIGGVRQKVLAAYRSGLTEVVLPARNGPDLEDVPDEVRDQMIFHLAERVEDVLGPVLGLGPDGSFQDRSVGEGADRELARVA